MCASPVDSYWQRAEPIPIRTGDRLFTKLLVVGVAPHGDRRLEGEGPTSLALHRHPAHLDELVHCLAATESPIATVLHATKGYLRLAVAPPWICCAGSGPGPAR